MSHHKLEVKNLSFTYPDGHKAIDGISFTVRHGESVGIVGENGAGKSTLLLVYDANGNRLYQLNSRGTDTVGKSDEIKIGSGTYYVKVEYEGYWHSSADYSLTVNTVGGIPKVKVFLNGKRIRFDQPPIIQNGRTLVPLRAIFEAMNATVSWDDKTKTVTAKKGDTTIVMTIGNKTMKKNGVAIELDVPPQIVNGRTLVPARAVAESFGAKVDWDGSTRTVTITEGN